MSLPSFQRCAHPCDPQGERLHRGRGVTGAGPSPIGCGLLPRLASLTLGFLRVFLCLIHTKADVVRVSYNHVLGVDFTVLGAPCPVQGGAAFSMLELQPLQASWRKDSRCA